MVPQHTKIKRKQNRISYYSHQITRLHIYIDVCLESGNLGLIAETVYKIFIYYMHL